MKKAFFSIFGALFVAACAVSNDIPDTPEGGNPCGEGATTCNGNCTVLARDPLNCGMCGTKCKDNEVCTMGRCALACGTGTLRCLNICVDSQSDPGNCGNCGVKCKMGEVCSQGKCAPSCAGGTTQCGSACVDTQVDRTNCGKCGGMCQGGEECIAGQCKLTCQAGLTECPNNYGDAGVTDAGTIGPNVCVDTYIDRYNCGKCGNVCPNNLPICRQGQCSLPIGACNNKKCDQGTDVLDNTLTWTVCSADCNTAWVSMLKQGGGKYHADWICKQLGYNKMGAHGGTCGNVCGYCQSATSCSMNGTANFDMGGTSCGSDQYGQILCYTVMWQCTM